MKKPKYIFKTIPWEHQIKALNYLYQRDVAALYTDMGTGKTKVMIDLIINRKFRRVLITCTSKGCDVWEREFKKHSDLQPEIVLNLSGVPTPKKVSTLKSPFYKQILNNKMNTLIIICNYESVWREPFASLLLTKRLGIDCVICDESHRIKSPSSKCSKFLTKIGKRVPYRYLVTGTPLAENPIDIYAQYRFLDPKIFGTRLSDFQDKYENLDVARTMQVGYRVLDSKHPYKNLNELQEKMFSCAFKAESSLKLPAQRNICITFKISAQAEKAYKELTKEGVLEYDEGTIEVENVLNLSQRQQQIVSGFIPVMSDYNEVNFVDIDKSRTEALEELLQGLSKEEPVVVFARFKRDLKNIKSVCQKLHRGYSELSGNLDTEADWQEGKTQILGVQYTSGSESVDFTKARYCIYYSYTTSLAQYLQSKKRIHRPGQTRPVVYYHIIAKLRQGISVDEKIVKALKAKKDVVDFLMNFEQKEKP